MHNDEVDDYTVQTIIMVIIIEVKSPFVAKASYSE